MIVIGGGPAGLSAALMLGRCRRTVAICDDGHPRNGCSHAVHGFFTRDGIEPAELLRIGRDQLGPYGVQFIPHRVTHALPLPAQRGEGRGEGQQFEVTLANGTRLTAAKLLLATGLTDELPRIEGLRELYGTSVFHCPYCDAWEFRERALAVWGRGAEGADFALGLKTWSRDVVLLTDGVRRMPAAAKEALERHRIRVFIEPISRLEGEHGRLKRIVFSSREILERDAMFFEAETAQRSDLAIQLGCEFTKRGSIRTVTGESTTVPGLYAAGDATHDVNFVSIAVAEGTRAAVAINRALRIEQLNERSRSPRGGEG